MRFKIKVDVGDLPVKDVVIETTRRLNKLLGDNNKWHDLERKPYTCSLLMGSTLEGRTVKFNGEGYFYVNTEDEEVIIAITNNHGIDFTIEPTKVFKGYNILTVKRIRYNRNGKTEWINKNNQGDFIKYVKDKYGVLIEILKISNSVTHYKNGSKISTSDLLIRCANERNVANLFESGIGGSCSLGFGFVEPLNKN